MIVPGNSAVLAASGLLTAFYPTLVYATTHVQVAVTATTLLVWTLVLAYLTGKSARTRHTLLTGVLLGLLALTDPILALTGAGAVWAIAQGINNSINKTMLICKLTALMTFSAVVVVSPWIVRNALVHGEFVAIKSTFGYAFWQGNCALSQGTDKIVRPSVEAVLGRDGGGASLASLNQTLWAARHEAGYLDDIALSRDDYRLLGSVSEPERSRILFRRAIADLRADPLRFPTLCLRRLRYFWLFDPTNPKTRVRIYQASHLALTGLAFLGLILAAPQVRRRLAPTILTAGLIALFHVLTIVSARFHIPIEPLMALWAAGLLARGDGQSLLTPAPHHVVGVRIKGRLVGEALVEQF
jgi:hypothetical protein